MEATQTSIRHEILRKSVHAAGVLVLPLHAVLPTVTKVFLCVLLALYFLAAVRERWFKKGLWPISTLTKHLKRTGSFDFGPVALALGMLITLSFFKSLPATLGILQVCLADSAAALVGKYLGRRKIFYSSKKSYVGSLAFFAVAFVVQWPWLHSHLLLSLWLAALGTLIESLPIKHWDNLIIPLAVSGYAALFF